MADFPININATSKENVSNKSTSVNTDQASNAKYPSVKALFDWATALFFPKPTGTNLQYLRGDGSLATLNLASVGIQSIQDLTPSSVVTGTTTETIVKSIPLWTLTNGSILRLFNLKLTKIAVAACTVKLYINNIDNNLSGAIQIATTGGTWPNTGRYVDVLRTFNIVGGNIEGLSSTAGTITDTVNNTSQHSSQSLPSGQLYLIVTVQNGAVGEETTFRSVCLKNF
jgi:hypothetical protein